MTESFPLLVLQSLPRFALHKGQTKLKGVTGSLGIGDLRGISLDYIPLTDRRRTAIKRQTKKPGGDCSARPPFGLDFSYFSRL
jgi:hypothetical protein